MYDVAIGRSKDAGARVLLTVDDEGAAQRIASALNAESAHWFQTGGKAFTREVDRRAPAPATTFDPGAHTVADLEDGKVLAKLSVEELDAAIAAEVAGKNRGGAVGALEAARDAKVGASEG